MTTETLPLHRLELHSIARDYEHLRWRSPRAVMSMALQIKHYGQLQPVVVIPAGPQPWLLIDGYRRVLALAQLGEDTVRAEIWPCSKVDALLRSLHQSHSHGYNNIEQANVLRELKEAHGLSQSAIARQLGRDVSWVNRRLLLVEELPDFVVDALMRDTLSAWSASRVLAPLARANAQHAKALVDFMSTRKLSTRDIQHFYTHYAKSNTQVRNTMCAELELFFKAHHSTTKKNEAGEIERDPESRWLKKANAVKWQLTTLMNEAPSSLHAASPLQKVIALTVNEIVLHTEKLNTITQEILNA